MLVSCKFDHLKVFAEELHFVEFIEPFAVGWRLEDFVGAINAGNRNFCFAQAPRIPGETGFDVWNEIIAGEVIASGFDEGNVWRAMSDGGVGVVDDEVAFGCNARLKEPLFAGFGVDEVAADAEMCAGEETLVEGAFTSY